MATEPRKHPNDQIPYLDEVAPPITDSAEREPITAADIAHTVERLDAGKEQGEYTELRESDLAVLSRLTPAEWQEVKRDPTRLQRLVTPIYKGCRVQGVIPCREVPA